MSLLCVPLASVRGPAREGELRPYFELFVRDLGVWLWAIISGVDLEADSSADLALALEVAACFYRGVIQTKGWQHLDVEGVATSLLLDDLEIGTRWEDDLAFVRIGRQKANGNALMPPKRRLLGLNHFDIDVEFFFVLYTLNQLLV